MNLKSPYFEKYLIAPSPNRDYYGLKVFADQVILYQWKISHGPHLFPVVRVIKNSEFSKDKQSKDLIEHVFGARVLRYLELVTSYGPGTLLTLPREIVGKLVKYLNVEDITGLVCASSVCNEIFDTELTWEIFYRKLKGSADLSNMEKEVVANRGFKKLVKDHQARSTAKKSINSMEDKLKRSHNTSNKTEKVVRSASLNIPKTSLQDDLANETGKRTTIGHSVKIQKPLKSLTKTNNDVREIKYSLPKKSTSEAKSSILADTERFAGKNIAIEGYRSFKSIKESAMKNLNADKESLNKFKFVNEDQEQTELLLPKRFLKSAIGDSDLSDNDNPEEVLKSKSVMIESPKNVFVNRSSHVIGDSKIQLRGKATKQNKPKEQPSKMQKSVKNSTKSARTEDKSDDSDESGMSFLMKRYLEASNEVAKKFSECQRLANTTKNSSVQVDMKKKAERKPVKKMQNYAPFLERSTTRKKLT